MGILHERIMKKLKRLDRFYVYVHRRNDNNEVFYVGKGSKDRYRTHHGRNKWWKRVVAKYGFTPEIVEKDLFEFDALELEKELIKFYRENNHKLVNICEGGNASKESKKKLRDLEFEVEEQDIKILCSNGMLFDSVEDVSLWLSKLGFINVKDASVFKACRGQNKSLYGFKWRFVADGEIMQCHHTEDISSPLSHIKRTIICSNGMIFESAYKAKDWLVSNGVDKASSSSILSACRGVVETVRGYRWRFLINVEICTEFHETHLYDPIVKVYKKVRCSNGMIFESNDDAATWLRKNGFPSANSSYVSKACSSGGSSCGLFWEHF